MLIKAALLFAVASVVTVAAVLALPPQMPGLRYAILVMPFVGALWVAITWPDAAYKDPRPRRPK